jgi:hypothetical protein
MARGDQFVLLILTFFFINNLIAFAFFVGVGKLLNYRALKDRPVSWRVAGTIGVIIWTMIAVFVNALNYNIHNRPNTDALEAVVAPALVLLGVVWFTRLLVLPAK